MSRAMTNALAGRESPPWAAVLFRAGRVCLLTLAAVLCFESITALREALLGLGAVLLAVALFIGKSDRFRPTPLLWPLAIYAVVVLLSLLSSVAPYYSLSEVRGELLKGVVVFYAMVHLVGDEAHLRQAWTVLLIGAALMSGSGLLLLVFQDTSLVSSMSRAGSLAEGYQYFATYLVLVWPFILLAPLMYSGSWPRWLAVALIPLAGAAAYITQTRGAWLALALEVAVLLVVLSRRRVMAVIAGLLLCAGVVAVVVSMPQLSHGEKWNQLFEDPTRIEGSAGDLVSVWGHAFQEIRKHPFAGIGYGRDTFMRAYPEFRQSHQPLLWHTHNVFVESALHLGVQGLIALLLVLGVLAATLWQKSPPSPGDIGGLFCAGALATLAGFCLRNMTDSLFVDSPAQLFWLIMGLAMACRYLPAGGQKG